MWIIVRSVSWLEPCKWGTNSCLKISNYLCNLRGIRAFHCIRVWWRCHPQYIRRSILSTLHQFRSMVIVQSLESSQRQFICVFYSIYSYSEVKLIVETIKLLDIVVVISQALRTQISNTSLKLLDFIQFNHGNILFHKLLTKLLILIRHLSDLPFKFAYFLVLRLFTMLQFLYLFSSF